MFCLFLDDFVHHDDIPSSQSVNVCTECLHKDACGAAAERETDGHHGDAALGLGGAAALLVARRALHPPLGPSATIAFLQGHGLPVRERKNSVSSYTLQPSTLQRPCWALNTLEAH